MKTKTFNRYSFSELLAAATAPDAEQIDVDTLGAWFERYGDRYWCSEGYYDASAPGEPTGSRPLWQDVEWDAENDQGEVVGYHF